MRLGFRSALVFACATMLLAGCEPNQLYMASHTVVGINAAVNPDQTSGSLIIGYDRTFATVIPRSAQSGDGTQDAMSALACSSLAVKGITIKRYTESIATGEAARTFASNLGSTDTKTVKDFFDCFKSNTPGSSGTPTTTPATTGASQ